MAGSYGLPPLLGEAQVVAALATELRKWLLLKIAPCRSSVTLLVDLFEDAKLVEEVLLGGGVDDIFDLAFLTRANVSLFTFW